MSLAIFRSKIFIDLPIFAIVEVKDYIYFNGNKFLFSSLLSSFGAIIQSFSHLIIMLGLNYMMKCFVYTPFIHLSVYCWAYTLIMKSVSKATTTQSKRWFHKWKTTIVNIASCHVANLHFLFLVLIQQCHVCTLVATQYNQHS